MNTIHIEKNKPLRILNNKVSTICIWDYREQFLGYGKDGQIKEMNPFVERVQFMTATGGNLERDLYQDPANNEVHDDYDFSKLLTACENALRLGVKPFIKTGSIPVKMTKDPKIGRFGVNIHAPVDMEEYYNYIYALAVALKEKFGLDEVKSWGYGVFTEFENKEWFKASEDYQEATELYCKVYDYTVAALVDALGEDIYVGTHAMTHSDYPGLVVSDVAGFIRHCGEEMNAKTGKPVKIDYIAVSFYDGRPFAASTKSLAQVAEVIRMETRKYKRLANLRFACDEGRINSGTDKKELSPRTVGFHYQAAMDADLIWQMVNNDIDYFSAWSYLSGGVMDGIKSLGSHIAEEYYNMVGLQQVECSGKNCLEINNKEPRANAVAGVNEKGEMQVMIYNYFPEKYLLEKKKKIKLTFASELPNGSYEAKCKMIDDTCNFYPKWAKDRDAAGLKTEGRWSEESPEIMTKGFDPEKYRKYSELTPVVLKYKVRNHKATAVIKMVANTAAFLKF